MDIESVLPDHVLRHYLILSPVFLVYLIGLVLAVMRWSRHPRVSLLAFLGISTLFVRGLAAMPILDWLVSYSEIQDLTPVKWEQVWLIVGIVDNLVIATAWGLVLAAIFGWRNEPMRDLEETISRPSRCPPATAASPSQSA